MSLVPPTSPVGVAGTAPAATVGTLVNAPESLKAVDPGTIVKGTVEGRDRQGNMIVRTDHGVVALRTAANFRPGTAVTMEVRVVGDSQHVVVLSADRRPAAAQQPGQQPLPQQPAQQPAQQPSQQPAQQSAQQPAQPGTQPAPTQGAGQATGGAPAPSAPAQPAPAQPAVSVASSPVITASTQPPQPLQAGQSVQALLLQTLAGQAQANSGNAATAAAQGGATQAGPVPAGTTQAGQTPATPATPAQTTPAQAASPQTPPPPGTATQGSTPQPTAATSSPAAPTPTPASGTAAPNSTVPTTGGQAPTPAPTTPAPPQTGVPQTGAPQTGTPQAAGPAAPTPSTAAPAGTSPAATGPTAAPAPAQSGLPGQIPSGQVPGQPALPPSLPPSLTAPAASATTAALPAGAPTTQILQALPAGSTLAVTVNSVLPPAPGKTTAPTPGLQPLPGGGATLTATVVGSTAAGQPLLQTSFGLVTIPGAQGLPTGTGVTLGLSPTALGGAEAAARAALGLSSGGAAGTAAAAGQPGGLGRSWPALTEAFVQLSQTNPALAQTLLQTAIPQPGQQLAGALLFFMAALRGGDVRGWMGDQAARALGGRDGRNPLLSRLGDDMGQMTRTGTDAAGNEWRAFYIPLFDGRDLQQIRLFMRDPTEEGDGGKEGASGHRFLIDLDLSKLGALQLDGLARTERLDLIVRTHRALPRDIKAEIVRLFEETAERVGLKGQVSFQATPHFPPLPFVEHNEIIEIHGEIEA